MGRNRARGPMRSPGPSFLYAQAGGAPPRMILLADEVPNPAGKMPRHHLSIESRGFMVINRTVRHWPWDVGATFRSPAGGLEVID